MSLTELFNTNGLGKIVAEPLSVSGGLIHKMWRVETRDGIFAVKQLSDHIKITSEKSEEFERTERIARRFSKEGIPSVAAVEFQGRSLLSAGNDHFLLYPWIDAKAVTVATEKHIKKIASIFAAMHDLKLKDVALRNRPPMHLNKRSFAGLPDEEILIGLNEKAEGLYPMLQENSVISHGDLDIKNVLWTKEGDPLLIDWESARSLNPMYEIVNAALDWSGLYHNPANIDLFSLMIRHYKKAGGIIDTKNIMPVLYAIARNWIEWLLFNHTRTDVPDIAKQEVDNTHKIVIFLDREANNLASRIIKA